MTEDQKAVSLILDLLESSKKVPRTLQWIESEVRLSGRRCEVSTILEGMLDDKLVASAKDRLKIRRYTITDAGREALSEL